MTASSLSTTNSVQNQGRRHHVLDDEFYEDKNSMMNAIMKEGLVKIIDSKFCTTKLTSHS